MRLYLILEGVKVKPSNRIVPSVPKSIRTVSAFVVYLREKFELTEEVFAGISLSIDGFNLESTSFIRELLAQDDAVIVSVTKACSSILDASFPKQPEFLRRFAKPSREIQASQECSAYGSKFRKNVHTVIKKFKHIRTKT